MNQIIRSLLVTASLSTLAVVNAAGTIASYHVAGTFPIGGPGRWDYVTVDSEHHLIFLPRTTHTLVIDAKNGKTVADILGQTHNHGVALVPKLRRGFISDGDDASVFIFDLTTYQVLGKIKTEPDSDGIIYDAASNKVLVVSGDGGVVIPIAPDVDPVNGKAEPRIELGGKPEYLATDGQGKVFINLADKDQIAVLDTLSLKVVAHWPTAPGGKPVGMAIDPAKHRLFIGCRGPTKMIVMSADDGRVLGDVPIGAGVDATVFDGYALASCGDGTLSVVEETSPGKFEVVQTVATKSGARTMGLDTATHTLYLPTADMETIPGSTGQRPKAGSFVLEVVKPGVSRR